MLTQNKINQFKQKYRDYPVQSLRDECDRAEEEIRGLEEDLKAGRLDSAMEERLESRMDFIEYCRRNPENDTRSGSDNVNPGCYADPSASGDGGFQSQSEARYLKYGQYLQAVAAAGSPAGVRYGQFDSGKVYRNILEPETRAATGMGESIPSTGGFLVGSDMASEIFMKVHQTSKVWDRVRQIPISTNANGIKIPTLDEISRANGARAGGILGYWIGEAGTKTASSPKFGALELSLKKLVILAYTTDELLQDAAALGEFMVRAASEEIGFKLDDGVLNGTGSGQLLGLNNANALVTVEKENGQTADTIVYENILQMIAQFWAAGFENAVWLGNQNIIPQLYAMNLAVGTAAVPVFSPANGSSGSKSTLFGRPIIFIEQAPTLGDKGDLILADLTQYVGIVKGGIQAAQSIHLEFLSDQTIFRYVFRVDGQPMWSDSLTPYKGSDSISPYVVIEARE